MTDEISLEEIKAIIDLIRQSESITSFTLKYGGVEISLGRGEDRNIAANAGISASEPRTTTNADAIVAPAPETAPIADQTRVKAGIRPGDGEVVVKAPMVGTFYRCPKPGEPPFVEVGDAVQDETVLGIIEVMKLMSSLEAKVNGIVTRILVEDAQPVEHGQPLMLIKVAAS